MERLRDRVAVVTGGADGIGLATCRRMAAEGATVVVADIDVPAGKRLADELGGLFVPADVSSPEDNDHVYAQAYSTFGRVDVAVHAVGGPVPGDGSILDTPPQVWRRAQDAGITATYLGCRAVLPYMLEQRTGSIINRASFGSTMGSAISRIGRTATDGAVLSLSRELGVQFAQDGIRVNAVSAGPVAAPMLDELGLEPDEAERRMPHVPMARFAEPEEVAAVVAFLASDDAAYVTASNVMVDGGITGAYVTPV